MFYDEKMAYLPLAIMNVKELNITSKSNRKQTNAGLKLINRIHTHFTLMYLI